MRAEEPEDMKGKYKDTMKGMFNNKARDSESFHQDLMQSLDDNKKKYDRQLYSDWLIKVYTRCTNVCVKPSLPTDNPAKLLREVEKQCARNCMRKFDRAYKTFDQVEQRIFEEYVEQENLDPEAFFKAMQQQQEMRDMQDLEIGEKLTKEGKL